MIRPSLPRRVPSHLPRLRVLRAGVFIHALVAVPALVRAQEPTRSWPQSAEEHGPRPHPHEPQGFRPFAELDCSSIPTFPRSTSGAIRGTWYASPKGNPNLQVGSDPTAPVSPPGVFVTRYPRGMRGGIGPVNFGGWDVIGPGPEGEKSKIYLSLWIKIEGRDYENQVVGTKVGFIAVGRRGGGNNETTIFLTNGTGRQALQSRLRMQLNMQGLPQPNGYTSRVLTQNVRRDPLMTVGEWHHWEAVYELNSPSRADGKIRLWIDGTLVMQHDDLTYLTPGTPRGFNLFKWNPTWGGSGGRRTREDRIMIDHIYLSGVDLERREEKD